MISQTQFPEHITDENPCREYSRVVASYAGMTGLEGLIYCELARVGVERSAE